MPDWLCHHCATNSLQATLNFSISFMLGGQGECNHLFIAADNFDQRGEMAERYFKKKKSNYKSSKFFNQANIYLSLE